MIFCIMVYAASYTVGYFCETIGDITTNEILIAIAVSFSNYVHWMFCYIYLKQQIEVKYLLDKRIYAANQAILMQRNRENFCLEVTNIFNILVSIGLIVLYLWWSLYYYILYPNLIKLVSTGLKTVYLVIWSYALYALFTKFKSSERLLPKKRVFINHAALLVAFLLCNII